MSNASGIAHVRAAAAVAVALAVLSAPAVATASRTHHRPRALAAPGMMQVRPQYFVFPLGRIDDNAIDYFYGPGTTMRQIRAGRGPHRVHWLRWGRRAVGRGVFMLQVCGEHKGVEVHCTHRYQARAMEIQLWRARRGHYTRMRFHATTGPRDIRNTQPYEVRRLRHSLPGQATHWCATTDHSVCLGP